MRYAGFGLTGQSVPATNKRLKEEEIFKGLVVKYGIVSVSMYYSMDSTCTWQKNSKSNI